MVDFLNIPRSKTNPTIAIKGVTELHLAYHKPQQLQHHLVHWSIHQHTTARFLNGFDEATTDLLWATHWVVPSILRLMN